MRRFVDLHTHSSASDGDLRPAELIALADREQLLAVALTDHDTTAGLAEARLAAEGFAQLRFIPGIEVSAASPAGILHVLALGIDETSPALAELAAALRAARDKRNPKIVAKLQALGMHIDMDDVAAQATDSPGGGPVLGRLHIAHAMAAKGYVRTADEAFDRFIGRGKPAYGEKDKLPPAEVIAAAGRLQSHSTSGANSIAQKAALAAITGDQSTVEEMRQAFDALRDMPKNSAW